MSTESSSRATPPPPRPGEPMPLQASSDDVLERVLARMRANDASDAPELAGAIAAILAARLEGTSIPDDVQTTLDAVSSGVPESNL